MTRDAGIQTDGALGPRETSVPGALPDPPGGHQNLPGKRRCRTYRTCTEDPGKRRREKQDTDSEKGDGALR